MIPGSSFGFSFRTRACRGDSCPTELPRVCERSVNAAAGSLKSTLKVKALKLYSCSDLELPFSCAVYSCVRRQTGRQAAPWLLLRRTCSLKNHLFVARGRHEGQVNES